MLKKSFIVELKFYKQLQKVFNKISLLIYYNFTCVTYINVDVFKRRNFEIVIYYLKLETDFNNLKHEKIKSIMFFNRIFTSTKKRY